MATRKELETLLTGYGWASKPIYPHLWYKDGVPYRYRFTELGLRRETRVRHEQGPDEWIRIRSGYYKNIVIRDGKITGMKRTGM